MYSHWNITLYHHQTYYFIVLVLVLFCSPVVFLWVNKNKRTKKYRFIVPIISKNMGCLVCNLSDSSLLEMIAVCFVCYFCNHTFTIDDDVNVYDDGQFHCHLIHLWMILLGILCRCCCCCCRCSYIKCIHYWCTIVDGVVYNVFLLTWTSYHLQITKKSYYYFPSNESGTVVECITAIQWTHINVCRCIIFLLVEVFEKKTLTKKLTLLSLHTNNFIWFLFQLFLYMNWNCWVCVFWRNRKNNFQQIISMNIKC